VITGSEDDRLEVVDGQQRLATTTILLAAIRDYFYNSGDRSRAEDIARRYLMDRDLRSQEILPRLHLNEVDHNFFSKRILTNPDDPARNAPATKESHRRIAKGAEIAAKHVKTITNATNDPTETLFSWIDYLQLRAKVIRVAVPDYANAFSIFETLNDRGLALAISDLLKNYLFSHAHDRIDEVQHKWISMIGVLESSVDSEEIVITYIRHLWSSKEGLTREKDLYDKIKQRITSKQYAVDFSIELYSNSRLYAAILNSSHELWDRYGSTAREHMATLNELGMIQMRPLLLSVLDKFSDEEIRRSLSVMVSWAVRFLIYGGLGGGTLENYYSQRAVEIRNGSISTTRELIAAMQSVVPSDKQFEASFQNASVSKSYLARYYLRVLERQARNEPEPTFIPSSNEEIVTLEHILPQNPSNAWGHIDTETAKAYYNRIGNLTLIRKKHNSEMGNMGFTEKLQFYNTSLFMLTSTLTQYDNWGIEQIEDRQKWLAGLAVKAWPNKVQ
jgi:Protein of unknown function (DUF1524)/Protein of unknown function DUF262